MCDARPTCQSWQKNTAPSAFTALTMGFHASTCSSEKMPGVFGSLRSSAPVRLSLSVCIAAWVCHSISNASMRGCYNRAACFEQQRPSCSLGIRRAPEAAARRAGALGKHERALACSLRVVLSGGRLRHSPSGAGPGQRRVADAVDQREGTEVQRLEERLVLTDVRGPCTSD